MRYLGAVFLVLCLDAMPAYAQRPGSGSSMATVRGTITDPSGAILAGATLEATAATGGPAVVATSDSEGRYRLELAAGSRHAIRAFLDGFADAAFELQIGTDEITRDIVLQVGGLRDTVVVTAGLPQQLTTPAATGSRLALTPLETPASVETVSGETIRLVGDRSVGSAASRATGIVNTSSAFGQTFSARGFSGNNSVMQLYDGMRMYTTTMTFPTEPWMAERIEVLRGPASVLYGEGAIGAAINVVRREPTRTRRSEMQLTGGSFGAVGLAAGSGGPVGDRVAYRVDVALNRSDGWMDRGDARTSAVSGALRFEASKQLQFTLSHDFSDLNPTKWFGVTTIDGVFRDELRRKNYNVSDAALDFKDGWTQVKAQWRPSPAVVVDSNTYYLTSYKHWRNAERQTWNPAASQIVLGSFLEITYHQWQAGNRTTLRHDQAWGRQRNSLVAGFDVNRGWLDRSDNAPFGGSAAVDPLNPVPVPFINLTGSPLKFETELSQYAVFAEDRLVLSDRWSVVGGLRYDRPTVERIDAVSPAASFETTFPSLSGRAGVVFMPVPALALYGQFATAADPVTSLVTTNLAQRDYELTTGRQFEAGVKHEFWAGRGEWTFAAYDIVKKNILTSDLLNPGVSVQIGQQSSRGVEASVSVAPGGGLSLQGNISLLDPVYDDFAESVGGIRIPRDGNVAVDTPRRSANAIAIWQFAPMWRTSAAVRFVGERFRDAANTSMVDSYTLVDVTLQRDVLRYGVLGVTIRNLTNELYARNIYGPTQWVVGEPRAVEVLLGVRF